MENCLKTKLKAEVQNNDLPKIEELELEIRSTSGTWNSYVSELPIENTQACIIRSTGGAYFAETFAGLDNPGTRLTELTIPANTKKSIFIGNSDGKVFIGKKYSLVVLGHPYARVSSIMFTNTEQLKYCNLLETLNIGNGLTGDISNLFNNNLRYLRNTSGLTGNSIAFNSNGFVYLYLQNNQFLTGNLSELQTCPYMQDLYINGSKISGDAADLAKFPVSANINIYSSLVTGTIESLVSAFVNEGISSYNGKNLALQPCLNNLTFGGSNRNTGGDGCFLSWESASKMFLGYGAASYASCDKILCKGYTQQEAEAKWPGKTIVRVDA